MTLLSFAVAALICAAIPALLFWANLRLYRPPPNVEPLDASHLPSISILVPARDEEKSIGKTLAAARASRGVEIEVIVLDDNSRDATAMIVRNHAEHDDRIRLIEGVPLPAEWCGKQHACLQLAKAAKHPLLLFVDADVRLAPDGAARLATFLQARGADLVSGIPRQETGTLVEKMVIPLIHFVLLGFLPMWRMRASRHPVYAAGCGQLFLAWRESYDQIGGHEAVRNSLHDGITLPHAFRTAGFMTDLCDATDLASCRMYRGASELWRGLTKNATEGLAKPVLIWFATGVLFGGQVLPWMLAASLPVLGAPAWLWMLVTPAMVFSCYPRLTARKRFRQSPLGAVLHPFGIVLLLGIQWHALIRSMLRQPAEWKGRSYPL